MRVLFRSRRWTTWRRPGGNPLAAVAGSGALLRCNVRFRGVQRGLRPSARPVKRQWEAFRQGTMTTSDRQGDRQGGDSSGGAGKNGPQQTQPAGAAEAPALAIIEVFGGIRPMAKTLGLAVSTVQGWKERSAIPTNRHDQIRAAARSHNIPVDPEMLRASAGESIGPQPQTTAEIGKAPWRERGCRYG